MSHGEHKSTVVITGSSGLVGSALTDLLLGQGYEVRRLVRGTGAHQAREGVTTAPWSPAHGQLDPESVSGCEAVVHLAGAGIADARWSAERKRVIRESRVTGTGLLARALAAAADPPRVLVSASATGYYGSRGDLVLDEGSGPGFGFLSDVAQDWEAATAPASEAGIRVVHLRIGVVLSPRGGALARMLTPFKAGFGGPLGDGRQFWSWIALDDLLGTVLHALTEDSLHGPVNACAPDPVRVAEFSSALGRVLRRPAFLRVPGFVLKLLLGEMADELLLSSTRVRPARLLESGFEFRFPELEMALRHLLDRPAGGAR
ncbi:MAG: TIGR01777 family oxidoreductase [marine benthic group bacterium]|nr:TIGR01777 family oxidoreductase [Candidatus Benthicola marisminoris]